MSVHLTEIFESLIKLWTDNFVIPLDILFLIQKAKEQKKKKTFIGFKEGKARKKHFWCQDETMKKSKMDSFWCLPIAYTVVQFWIEDVRFQIEKEE